MCWHDQGVLVSAPALRRGQGLLLFLGPAEAPPEAGSHSVRSWPAGPMLEEALRPADCLPLLAFFIPQGN